MSFVTFPGLAGNYASTPDVNLFDSDSAHFQQAVGVPWLAGETNATLQHVVDGAVTPVFGSGVAEYTYTSTSQALMRSGVAAAIETQGVQVQPNTLYTLTGHVYTDDPGVTLLPALRWYSGNNAQDGSFFGTDIPITPGVWNTITISATSSAGAAYAMFEGRVNGHAIGTVLLQNAFCLSESAGFVPSLRIVGTLTEQFDATPDDPPVVFLGDGTPLKIGDGWAGNLTSYIRRDGDATAPIVAQFDATDVGGVL